MAASEAFSHLRVSVEEQYLQDFRAEHPTDIYFELASIIAARTVMVLRDVTNDGVDTDLLDLAEKNARDAMRYAIGYRACVADLGQNNQVQLEKLMTQVRGF
jgi:hypothetical protein